ncbi:MAG: hypothetical protein R6U04_04795 [Bacteroidales bacterium]
MNILSALKHNHTLLERIYSRGDELRDIRKAIREEAGLEADNKRQLTIGVGHQPVPYYPGLLMKNLFTGLKAKELNITALNFVVDSDHGDMDIPVPRLQNKKYVKEIVSLKKGSSDIVFREFDPGEDVVDDFFERTKNNLATLDNQDIFRAFERWEKDFWKIYNKKEKHFIDSLEVMRRSFEERIGINLQDVKISHIVRTEAYYRFLWYLISNMGRFCEIYNKAVLGWSSENYQPVKCLYSEDGWTEIPFWLIKEGQRFSVEISKKGHKLYIRSVQAKEQFVLNITHDPVIQLKEKTALYPKASTLTIMLRLFFCDIFVHGIGAVEYEKVNNEFFQNFFELQSKPVFYAVTGDIYLPFFDNMPKYDEVKKKYEKNQQWLKDYKHKPMSLLDKETSLKYKQRKMHVLKAMKKEENKDKRKEYNEKLKKIDKEIKEILSSEYNSIKDEIQRLQFFFNNENVLFERQYPYFIFPENVLTPENMIQNMVVQKFG